MEATLGLEINIKDQGRMCLEVWIKKTLEKGEAKNVNSENVKEV